MTLHSALIVFPILSTYLATLQVYAASRYDHDCLSKIDQELAQKLSPRASIVHDPSTTSRFSNYYAPQPGLVVNVAEERDVIETVKYCIENNLKFLTQSGGHGWGTTFNIDDKDIIINMRDLNQVRINDAKDKLTFGGGALVSEIKEIAYGNQVQPIIPSCKCVGMSGATLGGGVNVFMGRYGLVIDNLLSINLVTAKGELITVIPDSEPDLWWALRGAGANFGIVTSMTMKVYSPINNGIGWMGTLAFSSGRLEDLIQVLSDSDYPKDMFLQLRFSPSSSDFTPAIELDVVYSGSQDAAKVLLKPLYDLSPLNETSKEVPYNRFTDISDFGCVEKGLRVPAYTAGMKKLDPRAFRKIWDEYVSFVSQNPNLLKGTGIFIEVYPTKDTRQFPNSNAAFPHRDVKFTGVGFVMFNDSSLDFLAEKFGTKVRQLMEESGGFQGLRAYVNYGHGDEDPKEIYGESLIRLKELKKKWDPNDRFSQFFPIPRE